MLKKVLQICVFTMAISVLSACSSTGTGANSTNGADSASNPASVETLGAGGSNDSGALSNPNAMVPGANQRYFFDYNKDDVHASDLPSIKVQAQYLVSHSSASVESQGNTDIRGSREYNMALGQRRAETVKKTLLLDGAPASQIRTISYGAEKPIAMGNTETDYAQNRRVDLIYKTH